jgi:hypothetical protein
MIYYRCFIYCTLHHMLHMCPTLRRTCAQYPIYYTCILRMCYTPSYMCPISHILHMYDCILQRYIYYTHTHTCMTVWYVAHHIAYCTWLDMYCSCIYMLHMYTCAAPVLCTASYMTHYSMYSTCMIVWCITDVSHITHVSYISHYSMCCTCMIMCCTYASCTASYMTHYIIYCTCMIWSKETPPPGGVSYLLCPLIKNRE